MTAASPIESPMQHSESVVRSRIGESAQVLPELYDELRSLAANYLRGERAGHTLQRTALVHEAYLRLIKGSEVNWQNRAHFLAIFSRLMREILTNYANARLRQKRGGKDRLEAALQFYDKLNVEIPAVDTALRELEVLDPRQGQIVELRFFGGLSINEIAMAMKISPATVKREWATAKIWLRRKLFQDDVSKR
jgi:RNA polymerase sigma factor (TIGR02999 family)